MASKEEFDKSLRMSNISLLVSGISMFPIESKIIRRILKFIYYFNIQWLYTDVVAEFYWLVEGVREGKSVGELSFIVPCATICLLATAKSAPMYSNRESVVEIVAKLREIHPEDANPEIVNSEREEELKSRREYRMKAIKDSMRFLSIVVPLLVYSSIAVVLLFTSAPMLAMGYDYYNKGETKLKLPFLAKYFFDPYTKTMWPIMYFHQIWSTYIAAFNVLGSDTLLFTLCGYIKMHFELLGDEIENMVCYTDKETNDRMVKIVKKHQNLINIVHRMEGIYTRSTLVNITISTILICLSGFNIMFLEDRVSVIAFLMFLSMSVTQISLFCLFGDMLMNSSLKLSEAIYNSQWYETKGYVRKNILFCLIRTQRPCKLTASKFADVKLTTLTTILSRSWSLFALLRTMYK